MPRPIAMKLAFILFTLLLCAGCGATKSTQTPQSQLVGTWEGSITGDYPASVQLVVTSSGSNVFVIATFSTATCNLPLVQAGATQSGNSVFFGDQVLGVNGYQMNGTLSANGNTISGNATYPYPCEEGGAFPSVTGEFNISKN